VELVVLDWFGEWMGYPAAAAGALTSGGSAANMPPHVAVPAVRVRIAARPRWRATAGGVRDHLELLLPPALGVVCFRRRFDGASQPRSFGKGPGCLLVSAGDRPLLSAGGASSQPVGAVTRGGV